MTGRGHIFRWRRTHRSLGPFSRRSWGEYWRYARSEDYTIVTNDALPEESQAPGASLRLVLRDCLSTHAMHIRDRPCVSMAHRNRLPVSRTKNIPEEVKVAQGQTVFTITTIVWKRRST